VTGSALLFLFRRSSFYLAFGVSYQRSIEGEGGAASDVPVLYKISTIIAKWWEMGRKREKGEEGALGKEREQQ
jgi:hypothetical protein